MEKLTVKRDYSVIRDGNKIGSIAPVIGGWMPVDIHGKSDHYFVARCQADAAKRVATLFDRQTA